jgi:hypothetical protein
MLTTQYKKTICRLTIDNQIYGSKERIHHDEKRDWNNKKVALDDIVLRQQNAITELKNNTVYVRYFTRNCVYFSIVCGIMIIVSAMYSIKYGNSPL